MTLPSYAVDFRGLPACPCQAEWIPAFEAHLRRTLSGFQGTLSLAQLIGFFGGSGGTHAKGGASDFWVTGHMADLVVAEARQMGADPTWHRRAGWDGPGSDEHVHCVLRGCPHLSESARVQVACVDRNDDGLAGDALDSGPRPLSYRTWREGIDWAEEQDMASQETIDAIAEAVAKRLLDVEKVDGQKKVSVRQSLNQTRNDAAKAASK